MKQRDLVRSDLSVEMNLLVKTTSWMNNFMTMTSLKRI